MRPTIYSNSLPFLLSPLFFFFHLTADVFSLIFFNHPALRCLYSLLCNQVYAFFFFPLRAHLPAYTHAYVLLLISCTHLIKNLLQQNAADFQFQRAPHNNIVVISSRPPSVSCCAARSAHTIPYSCNFRRRGGVLVRFTQGGEAAHGQKAEKSQDSVAVDGSGVEWTYPLQTI